MNWWQTLGALAIAALGGGGLLTQLVVGRTTRKVETAKQEAAENANAIDTTFRLVKSLQDELTRKNTELDRKDAELKEAQAEIRRLKRAPRKRA